MFRQMTHKLRWQLRGPRWQLLEDISPNASARKVVHITHDRVVELVLQRCYFVLVLIKQCLATLLHWNKCQICSRAKNTNTRSRTWWYFQVNRWIQDSNESAISLIAKNIVLCTEKAPFPKRIHHNPKRNPSCTTRPEQKLQSSILSNSSLILNFLTETSWNN